MKRQLLKHITKSIFVLALLCVSYYSFTSGSGAPSGNTNAPGDGNCTSCHGGSVIISGTNWNNMSITHNIPAGGYVPGSSYTINVTHTISGINKWGFQFTAVNGSFAKVGTLMAGTGSQTLVGGWITHNASGTGGTGTKTWTFTWVAPASGAGIISFYAIVNAANGDNNTTGDQIYSKSVSVQEFSNMPTAVIDGIPPSGNLCLGDTLNLLGSGINSPTQYAWTFTGIINPTLQAQQNPKVIFTSVGQKTITLKTTNGFGSSPTTTVFVNVINRPPAPISPSGAVSICGSDSVLLSTDFNSLLTYLWSPGNQTTSSIKTVTAGTYKVKVTNTSTGCSTTSINATLTAAVKPVPVLTVSKDSICSLDSLTLGSSTPFTTYRFFDGSSLKYSGPLADYKGLFTPGLRNIGLVVTGSGCNSDTVRKTVYVQPLLAAPGLTCGSKTTSSVSFNWTAVSGSSGYEVSVDTGKTWIAPSGTLTHTVTGLAPNSNAQVWVRAIDPALCAKGNTATLVCTNGACAPITYTIQFPATACLQSNADSTLVEVKLSNISASNVGISYNNNVYTKSMVYDAKVFLGANTVVVKIVDSANVGCPRIDTTIQLAGINPITKTPVMGIQGALCSNDSSLHVLAVFNANSGADAFQLFRNAETTPFHTINTVAGDTVTVAMLRKLSPVQTGDILKAVAVDAQTGCKKPSLPYTATVHQSPKPGFTASATALTVVFTDTTLKTAKRDWKFLGAIPDELNGAKTTTKTFATAGKKGVIMLMTDSNGCQEMAAAEITLFNVGLKEITNASPLNIHPNPVGSMVYYTLEGTEDAQVTIYDLHGKLVKQQVVKDAENRVDVQMLTPGLYMIYISQSNNHYFSKFMKE
ncbi:MAG: choice-of-anchor V domain-containing protein [Bacteroidota bacterium]